MTEDEVRARIRLLVKADQYPKLSGDEVEMLVASARRADHGGRAPSDLLWEPTWNLNYALYRGWEQKQANCAAHYDIQEADQRLSRSQVFDMCGRMATQYKHKLSGSVTAPAPARAAYPLLPVPAAVPNTDNTG